MDIGDVLRQFGTFITPIRRIQVISSISQSEKTENALQQRGIFGLYVINKLRIGVCVPTIRSIVLIVVILKISGSHLPIQLLLLLSIEIGQLVETAEI